MVKALLITMLSSYLVTYVFVPFFARFFKSIGVSTTDVHKKKKPILPSSGGMAVFFGVVIGLFTFIAVNTFVYKTEQNLVELFSAISSVLLITLSGFFDDLSSRMQSYEGFKYKTGLKQWQKPLLTLPAVIPLMVINAGTTVMNIPFFGDVNFGLLYPLLIVPIAIVGCANMVNLLGGFNGAEAGMGIIYTFSLGLFALIHNQTIAAVLLLTTTTALLAFFHYNFVPAKILPGDSLTYALGGVVAVGTILANMEKFALMTMSLFIIEWFLKLRSLYELKHFAVSLGNFDPKTGLIKNKYKKVYSLTHLVMGKKGATERDIVIRLVILQTIVSIIPWILYG